MSETFIKSSNKEVRTVPKGATILKRDTRVEVEEIENGFLIVKNEDIKYTMKPDNPSDYNYAYITKKYYSKTDPVVLKTKDKSLADVFPD